MTTHTNKSAPFSFRFCRKVRLDRDVRYDGLFYSGSSNTKIYCRPICPGNPPLKSNNIYFSNRAQAEGAEYRPCLRCRPERAPDQPVEINSGWRLGHTLDKTHQGQSLKDFFTVWLDKKTPRPNQLATDIHTELGTSLSRYWKTFQLGFAKILLTDTTLPVGEISDISRFKNHQEMLNALFCLYKRDPLSFRKPLSIETHSGLKSCVLMLAYRPPLDWSILLNFFRARAIAGMEVVTDTTYQRSFSFKDSRGWLSLQNVESANAIRLEVHATDLSNLMEIVWRVKRMLDLNADPLALKFFFGTDTMLGPILNKYPGVRVPVAWDAFEYAVRAIAGQLISVHVATKLVTNIVETFGHNLSLPAREGINKIFPAPEQLKNANLHPFGLTKNKTAAITDLAKAVLESKLELEQNSDLELFIKQCTALRGIGEWTAHTIAMKGVGYKDAFPASDLGIVKALTTDGHPPKPAQIRAISECWRPLRSYAAMLLWSTTHK